MIMTKIKVYLAGDLLVPDWRKEIIDYFREYDNIEFVYPITYKESSTRDPRVYVIRDISLLRLADVVFAYIRDVNHKYSGTSAEIGMAKALGKTLVVVIENDCKTTNQFSFIAQIADSVCNTLDKGIDILEYMVL
jgi:nucleoside 2-deoxyribosyltransferase